MAETREKQMYNDEKKEMIRERFRGDSKNETEVISATSIGMKFEGSDEKRAGVYMRTAIDDMKQTSSLELLKKHYIDAISNHEGWKLIKIYIDEGASGASMQNRKAFQEMIRDCKTGKVDLIYTKSVSIFSRNICECINCIKELASLKPAVGIFFETENIYTLDAKSKEFISLMFILADE